MLIAILGRAIISIALGAGEPTGIAIPDSCDTTTAQRPREINCDPGRMPDWMAARPTTPEESRIACESLGTCLCNLLGGACANLRDVMAVLLKKNAVEFTGRAADEAHEMVVKSRDNSVNSDPSLFTLPYHSEVAKKFAAYVLKTTTDLHDYVSIVDSLITCNEVRNDSKQEQALRPSADKWDQAFIDWREKLLCTFRRSGGFDQFPLLSQWPSYCGCGSDGKGVSLVTRFPHHSGPGAFLAPVCLKSADPSDDFAPVPIDARMPEGIKTAMQNFYRRLPDGYTVTNIGLIGCTMLRMKTTRDMLRRTARGAPLAKDELSDHGRATACDLETIEVQCPPEAGCPGGKRVFRMADEKQTPFTSELRAFMRATGHRGFEFAGNRQNSAAQDQTYCHIEEFIQANPDGGTVVSRGKMSRDEWEEFKLGVFAQRSLREAGFTVETPFTNAEHSNHYHFELANTDNTPAPCSGAGAKSSR